MAALMVELGDNSESEGQKPTKACMWCRGKETEDGWKWKSSELAQGIVLFLWPGLLHGE